MSESAIAIGCDITFPEGHVDKVTEAVATILAAGHTYHHDQSTVRDALAALAKTLSVENVTISGASIRGGSTKIINFGGEEKDSE